MFLGIKKTKIYMNTYIFLFVNVFQRLICFGQKF